MIKHGHWIMDSGATDHIAYSLDIFLQANPVENYFVQLPNNKKALVSHIGTVKVNSSLILYDVLCVPSFKFNLISIGKLTCSKKNCVLFTDSHCITQDTLSWTVIGVARATSVLYLMQDSEQDMSRFCFDKVVKFPSVFSIDSCKPENKIKSFNIWHFRLGHAPLKRINVIHQHCPVVDCSDELICEICPLVNQRKLSFLIHIQSTNAIFQLIHADIWGPCEVLTLSK